MIVRLLPQSVQGGRDISHIVATIITLHVPRRCISRGDFRPGDTEGILSLAHAKSSLMWNIRTRYEEAYADRGYEKRGNDES